MAFYLEEATWFSFGLFLGHQFDKTRRLNQSGFNTSGFGRGPNQAERQKRGFQICICGYGACCWQGQVTHEDSLASTIWWSVWIFMASNAERRKMHSAKEREWLPVKWCPWTSQNLIGGHDLLQRFLELQVSAAFADGSLHPSERQVLHKIAQGLGFSAEQLDAVYTKMQEAAFPFQQQGGSFGGGHRKGSRLVGNKHHT